MGKQQMEADMKIRKMLLCSVLLLAVGLSAGCGGSQASSQTAPPNIRPGVKFSGQLSSNMGVGGLVKEVRGNWILVAADSSVSRNDEAWINFDNVTYYIIEPK